MAAQIISGKLLAAEVKKRVAGEVEQLKAQGINPCLAVMLVGSDPASQVYVRGKQNDCAECGIESRLVRLDENATQAEVLEQLGRLAADESVHGVLVQLPLPAQIDEQAVIAAIPPEKDVDGFTPVNVGRMTIGQQCFLPCTPAGCIEMLKYAGVAIEGKRAVVVGRSNIVGKPAALLLLRENATVTVCHSRTRDLAHICAEADILVAAIGKAKFITGDMIKPGAAVIDVGINRSEDGKLCGDVDFAAASEKAAFITPVPGGVGLMTRAMLLCNTVQAARMAAGR
ncbi:MAG TPA: bifunctional methylenetetrahydrofolate dehydrogenase/methenyltetrahydrofolate cyclohydrolase FolD [Candidatus Fournierella merdavium]|nr:bifunctional methylenetetrahydrofolate dehydrogenase/methenyltetrahydrofolate cyclohydrolase FolD [Candidatus Fournierella merdavium]